MIVLNKLPDTGLCKSFHGVIIKSTMSLVYQCLQSYIHGGAWRDPQKTADDFVTSIKHIMQSGKSAPSEIRGFVSIEYRLSPHPEFPQDSQKTKATELRSARHPDHVEDVWSALELFQSKYQQADNYILLVHSAGATLAFQLVMGDAVLTGRPHPRVTLPIAIVGISGIYDLVKIDARHDGQYAGFIEAAFGNDRNEWANASPALFKGNFKNNWANGKIALLAWSTQDTLVDEPEIDDMEAKLKQDGINLEIVKDLTGEHDYVWEDGSQVDRLVSVTLDMLRDQ